MADSHNVLCTRASLAADFRTLGIEPGMTLILHSSLRSLGWVCGGAVAVVQALSDVLTPAGTLVVPTQTGDNSDPAAWVAPPVPEDWWAIIREQMPAFDPALTPSQGMGAIAEAVRTWPGACRSTHPSVSFAAIGHHAELITARQPLEAGFGDASPLGHIYTLDGRILLLGVTYEVNTSFHLAQSRVPGSAPLKDMAAAMLEDGQRVWRAYRSEDGDTDDFEAIGAAFEQTGGVIIEKVGAAEARLMSQRAAVDYAVDRLRAMMQKSAINPTKYN